MSTGSAKAPVIFDIVNSIENMYPVYSIKEEMETAIAYCRSHIEEGEAVNDGSRAFGFVADRLIDVWLITNKVRYKGMPYIFM